MRTYAMRSGAIWASLLLCLGCTGNATLNNPFLAGSGGGPFGGGAGMSPSLQVFASLPATTSSSTTSRFIVDGASRLKLAALNTDRAAGPTAP